MRLQDACALADEWVGRLRPFCDRVEVAGSVRRRRPEVKDIEIVAIPKWETRHRGGLLLLPEERAAEPVNLLWEAAKRLERNGAMRWIKPGTPHLVDWPLRPDGRYWRGLILGPDYTEQIKLDLFLCDRDNWGTIFLIRTGSAEFSHAVANRARLMGRPFRNGRLTDGGAGLRPPHPIATAEEDDVFRLLRLTSIPPEERRDGRVLQARMPPPSDKSQVP
jgi:DNA polymerase/3'-5' exonuclease PolX